jgi:hypothetical protein
LNAAKHKRFGEVALPAAVKKDMGVIAMKVARDLVGSGPGQAKMSDLLASSWDMEGVACLITGMESAEQLDENVRVAASYTPGTAKAAAAESLNPQACWMQPGYRDECA